MPMSFTYMAAMLRGSSGSMVKAIASRTEENQTGLGSSDR